MKDLLSKPLVVGSGYLLSRNPHVGLVLKSCISFPTKHLLRSDWQLQIAEKLRSPTFTKTHICQRKMMRVLSELGKG